MNGVIAPHQIDGMLPTAIVGVASDARETRCERAHKIPSPPPEFH